MNYILRQAKLDYKRALRNKSLYKQRRANLIEVIVKSDTPNWGDFKLSIKPL